MYLKSFIKPVLYGFALFFLSNLLMSVPVFAQAAAPTGEDAFGPFGAFLSRAIKLFYQTRSALFVVAIFVFLSYAWTMIYEGKFEKEKVLYLIIGLVILGIAGALVSYMSKNYKSSDDITIEGIDITK